MAPFGVEGEIPAPLAEESLVGLRVAIVGAGVMGMHSALLLSQRGALVTVLEREQRLGGVWRSFANGSSRVQSAEPGYRVIPDQPFLEDFTPRAEVLEALEGSVSLLEQRGGQVILNATVTSVRDAGASVSVDFAQGGPPPLRRSLEADHVFLCLGGLQRPRRISLPGEEAFQGAIVDGISGAPDRVEVAGRDVAVLGMGAFAVENARECLFRGARRVTLVARHLNIVAPRMLTYLGMAQREDLRPENLPSKGGAGGQKPGGIDFAALVGGFMLHGYKRCSAEAALPFELLKMQKTGRLGGRESGGTVPTASDVFFMAHALGKLQVVRAEVARVLPDGLETKAGERIRASVVIKNFGFEDPDHWLPDLVHETKMHSPVFITRRIWLMKGERAQITSASKSDLGQILNLPPSAPMLAEVFCEVFAYWQSRPAELEGLLSSGALPLVDIGQDNYITLSKGLWALMQHSPVLRARINRARHRLAKMMQERYGSPLEFLRLNRAAWREDCKRLSGREDSVAYLWDDLEPMLKVVSRPGRRTRRESPGDEAQPEPPKARL